MIIMILLVRSKIISEKVTIAPGCLTTNGCDEHQDFMSMDKEGLIT